MVKKKGQFVNIQAMVIIATMLVLVILVIPIIAEYRINVTIGQNGIIDVSSQSIYVPLISKIFPIQSREGTGVYTIMVQFSPQEQDAWKTIVLSDVPIGQYTFILSDIQKGISYTVAVSLIRNGVTIDTFNIIVASF